MEKLELTQQPLLTRKQVAARLSVSVDTVDRMVDNGLLHKAYLMEKNRMPRFYPGEVERYVQKTFQEVVKP